MRATMNRRLRRARGAAAALCVAITCVSSFAQDAEGETSRIDRLNRAFLVHLRGLDERYAIAAATIVEGWEESYREDMPESFVPDALAVLYPAYRAGLEEFDAEKYEAVARRMERLLKHDDPYLAANAEYFYIRALAATGRYELIEEALGEIGERQALVAEHTPYAPHLLFIKAFCEVRNLRFEKTRSSLDELARLYPDMPEAVRVGARQLHLEIERRERETLGEAADMMDYVADRLNAADRSERVRTRQKEIVALLDRLIEQMEQQEQQQSNGQESQEQKPQREIRDPKQESRVEAGAGKIGDLHDKPSVQPGEAWGKLPPAEREKILQSIREKYPSRYRQLVEQYYRSLAEEK